MSYHKTSKDLEKMNYIYLDLLHSSKTQVESLHISMAFGVNVDTFIVTVSKGKKRNDRKNVRHKCTNNTGEASEYR